MAATEVQPGASLRISAVQFAKEYENNEEAADTRDKNKILEITGIVDEVDFTGDSYTVILKGGGPDESVRCDFAKDPATRTRLAKLKPGNTVTFRGKCTGHSTLEACVIVK